MTGFKVRPKLMCPVATADMALLQQLVTSGVTGFVIKCGDLRDAGQEKHRRLIADVRAIESRTKQAIAVALDVRRDVPADVEFAASADVDLVLADCFSSAEVSEIRKHLAQDVLIVLKNTDGGVSPDALSDADGVLVADSVEPAVGISVQECKSQVKLLLCSAPADRLPVTAPDCLLMAVTDPSPSAVEEMWHKRSERPVPAPKGIRVNLDEDEEGTSHPTSAFNVATNMRGIKAIVAISKSGDTVRRLAGLRPAVPVAAVVNKERMARQMGLLYGVIPHFFDGDLNTPHWHMEWDERVAAATNRLKDMGIVSDAADPADQIVVVTGPREVCSVAPGASVTVTLTVGEDI